MMVFMAFIALLKSFKGDYYGRQVLLLRGAGEG